MRLLILGLDQGKIITRVYYAALHNKIQSVFAKKKSGIQENVNFVPSWQESGNTVISELHTSIGKNDKMIIMSPLYCLCSQISSAVLNF